MYDLLEDVSGFFAPAVDGGGRPACVLFRYAAGQAGRDPGIRVVDADPMGLSNGHPFTGVAFSSYFTSSAVVRGARVNR